MKRFRFTRAFGRVPFHVVLAGFTGALFGAFDGFAAAGPEFKQRWLATLLGAGLTACAATLWGVLQGLIVPALLFLLERTRVPERLRLVMSRDRNGDRTPVVCFHARVLSALILIGVLHKAFALFVRSGDTIKEEELRLELTLLVVFVALAVLASLTPILASLLERPLRWFDTKVGLPFPKWGALRYLLFVALPLFVVLVPMFTTYGAKLGIMSRLFGAVLFFAAEGAVYCVWRPLAALLLTTTWRRRIVAAVFAAAAVTAYVASAWTLHINKQIAKVVADGGVLAVAANVMRVATDVDRDGISSLFGGQDCAPFDARRSPAKLEIPANGVDEDCNGADEPAQLAVAKLKTFYGQPLGTNTRGFNVLWLIVDSLRTDHMDLYGYKHETSPTITAFGKQSWVFRKAYSQASTTALSVPSMFAGRRPSAMTWENRGLPYPAPSERLIAELLTASGYHTTLITNDWVAARLKGLRRGFSHMRTAPRAVNWRSGYSAVRNAFFAMEQASKEKKPFFIAAHLDDVHHPYTASRGRAVPSYPNSDAKSAKELEAYDRGIAHLDNIFASILDHLQTSPLWDRTIVIVTSDHGEEFLDHGGVIHTSTCYRELVHVPLIMRVPGLPARDVQHRVSMTDVVPTLIELLGINATGLDLDGQSLLVPIYSQESVDPDRPLFCSIYQLMSGRQNFFTRAVRTKDRTLVHELLADRVELYDTVTDPGEQNDLSKDPKYAQEIEQLKRTLRASQVGNLFEVRRFK